MYCKKSLTQVALHETEMFAVRSLTPKLTPRKPLLPVTPLWARHAALGLLVTLLWARHAGLDLPLTLLSGVSTRSYVICTYERVLTPYTNFFSSWRLPYGGSACARQLRYTTVRNMSSIQPRLQANLRYGA